MRTTQKENKMEEETESFLTKSLGEMNGQEVLKLAALTAVVTVAVSFAVPVMGAGYYKTRQFVKGRIKKHKALKTIKALNEVA
jgi:hypothetical protein